MRGLIIIFAICFAMILTACSKDEPETTPKPAVQTAPKAAPLANKAVDEAKQVAKEVTEKAEKVVEQVEDKVQVAVQQAKSTFSTGQAIYTSSCLTCHKLGIAGAPKVGDKGAWASRIAGGEENMLNNAIKGIGSMPPKGGASKLSDEEIKAAVEYMVEESR
ncbi:MAG: c-type cytochrome [Desulfuromusa sp.]|nr:c-type cytochrome [Desulfuromusa sp.]